MKAKKILFITQEIAPYVPDSQMSLIGRQVPQTIQEQGFEIRSFMPRWGNINERRNQLHEVIRLSGMNIVIDETDHTLVLKVASLQAAKMQVYFIDNDDYFHKRLMLTGEDGTEYADNIERAVFYARGVLETVKKLRWVPDVIHCHGWISAAVPLYIKTAFRDDAPFAQTKVIFSAYDEMPQVAPPQNAVECLQFRDATADLIRATGIDFTQPDAVGQLALHFSDGFVPVGQHDALNAYAAERNLPMLHPSTDTLTTDEYAQFYQYIFGDNEA